MTRPETPPEPRVATLRTFVDPKNPNDVIDRGVAIFFPGPHSYTGEDVVELQVHGSIAVIRDILSALQSLPGFAAAEPGDFTKVRLTGHPPHFVPPALHYSYPERLS